MSKLSIVHLMHLAILEAQKAFALNEVPIGAVIYHRKTNKILAAGHNMVQATQNRLMHAESIVLQHMFQQAKTKYIEDMWLFVTLEPCAACMCQIINAGISRLYYGLEDYKYGALSGNQVNITLNKTKLQIYQGLMENESRELLQKFFQSLRKNILY